MMEKLATPEDRYKYLLLATTRTDTMKKELKEAGDAGYTLVGICSRGELTIVMEKAVE